MVKSWLYGGGVLGAAAAVGFAAGKWVDAKVPYVSESAGDHRDVVGAGGERIDGDRARSARPPRESEAETNAENEEGEKRLVPVKAKAVAALVGSHLGWMGFDRINRQLDATLELLAATDDEKRNVSRILENTRSRIHEAEKGRVVVTSTTAGGVILDLSGAREAAGAIAQRTREDLRRALDRNAGEALADGIRWQDFYVRNGSPMMKLRIYRQEGRLVTEMNDGFQPHTEYLDEAEFPPDKPVDAGKAFRGRWTDVLGGVMLEPEEQ